MLKSKLPYLIGALVVVLLASRTIANLILDYHWWGEMGQVETWSRMLAYEWLPGIGQWLLLFGALWVAHARGMKYAGTGLRDAHGYGLIATGAVLVLSFVLSASAVDGWTLARFIAGREVDAAWQDPAFGRPLSFYFFELPFYESAITYLAVVLGASAAVFYLTARFWQLRVRFPELVQRGQIEWEDIRRLGSLEAGMFKGLVVLFLLVLAARFWLGRFSMLYTDHSEVLTGLNYVQQNLGLPLQVAKAGAAVLAAALILLGRRKIALACVLVLPVAAILPPLVESVYVRPNELALERPFLERHIEATRSAYGLDERASETAFDARKEAPIDLEANRAMLNNVRLWEWGAFHDTLSQSQPLRPYTYADTDIDRYTIANESGEGETRQVMLAPRELDLSQIGAAQNSWVISRTIYTHGYGLALAEAASITDAGLPNLLVRNAPVEVLTPSLKVTRPEIYYGEEAREPVFVRTSQPEFNYPSGSDDVNTTYDGQGGFLIGNPLLRFAAAWALGDWNIVLSDALTGESRIMINRSIERRLSALAPYLMWDDDPYMVIDGEGHLQWIVDGYTHSTAHPYSRALVADGERINYIRNSVKAVVDAYHGTVRLYVFDDGDPLIAAYRQLFPELYADASEMSAELRAHTRFPEFLFRAQAEIYRAYHMRNPENFYNRADLWDLATFTGGQGSEPTTVEPTYLMATLPGESQPEFLLTIPFTPRAKQNLMGLMVARCDGEHLGEIVFLQLPKQEIIPGPLQIEALINQDDLIAKDLTLWNQQGSRVLRGQVLVLPAGNTFLYVSPIYIQAAQARMPQLEKVVVATGSHLVYEDTYQAALVELARLQGSRAPVISTVSTEPGGTAPTPATGGPVTTGPDPRISTIRGHLQRYKSLVSQGKMAEAGRELEQIEGLVGR